MATKNFRSTVLEPTSEFAYGDKLRFTALATVGEVLKGSFSETTIGEDGVYSVDLQYGKHRVDYKPYEGVWRHFADVEVNADTLATTLQDLALASVPVTDETILVLQGILADAEAAKTESATLRDDAAASAAAAEQVAADAAIWQTEYDNQLIAISSDTSKTFADLAGKNWLVSGFLVTKSGSSYSVSSGYGYVNGYRIELKSSTTINITDGSFVYIDAFRAANSVQMTVSIIESATDLADYVSDGVQHYVCKIAQVIADSIVDLRPFLGWKFKDNNDATAKLLQVSAGGGITAEKSNQNAGEEILTKLAGKAHLWGSKIADMPELGVSVMGYGTSIGNGTGNIKVAISTGTFGESESDSRTNYGSRWAFEINGNFNPQVDNNYSIGTASLRVKEIFAANAVINTSDEREKTALLSIDEAEKACALELKQNIKKFQFLESVQQKGSGSARIHFGVGAQTVAGIFKKHGLDPERYALFCKDTWEDTADQECDASDDGARAITNPKDRSVRYYRTIVTSSGERLGIRYSELAMFIFSAI